MLWKVFRVLLVSKNRQNLRSAHCCQTRNAFPWLPDPLFVIFIPLLETHLSCDIFCSLIAGGELQAAWAAFTHFLFFLLVIYSAKYLEITDLYKLMTWRSQLQDLEIITVCVLLLPHLIF